MTQGGGGWILDSVTKCHTGEKILMSRVTHWEWGGLQQCRQMSYGVLKNCHVLFEWWHLICVEGYNDFQ